MSQDYAASIQGSAIRISRLAADGTFQAGASGSYVQTAFISMKMTPEYESGEEVNQKGANGLLCVTFKTPDTLKRVTLEISICNPDPLFEEMLCGGVPLVGSNGDIVGYAPPLVGVDGNPNGVAIEVWGNAIVGGKKAATNPYWHWVLPFATMRPSGDRTIENGVMANVYQGYGVGNLGFGKGPSVTESPWAFPAETHRSYAYARTASAPSIQGYRSSINTP